MGRSRDAVGMAVTTRDTFATFCVLSLARGLVSLHAAAVSLHRSSICAWASIL